MPSSSAGDLAWHEVMRALALRDIGGARVLVALAGALPAALTGPWPLLAPLAVLVIVVIGCRVWDRHLTWFVGHAGTMVVPR